MVEAVMHICDFRTEQWLWHNSPS